MLILSSATRARGLFSHAALECYRRAVELACMYQRLKETGELMGHLIYVCALSASLFTRVASIFMCVIGNSSHLTGILVARGTSGWLTSCARVIFIANNFL